MMRRAIARRRPGSPRWVSRWTRHHEARGVVRQYSSFTELTDAEVAILERVAGGAAQMRMLDAGVGAGRTTLHCAPHFGEYVGIDISEGMISACRARFSGAEHAHVSFEVADVRDMSRLDDERFDFVLFSWNGLDEVGDEHDRVRALGEIKRVCARGAAFAFSSHNLQGIGRYVSLRAQIDRARSFGGPVPLVTGAAWGALLRVANPPRSKLDRMPSAEILDTRRPLTRNFYIRPQAQIQQLLEVGFRDPIVFASAGEEVPAEALPELRDHSLYYLCWK
jgi:SAM-dependent methyltransferase